MAICQKRRDELISLLNLWYEMNWSIYFDLSNLQTKLTNIFNVSFHL